MWMPNGRLGQISLATNVRANFEQGFPVDPVRFIYPHVRNTLPEIKQI